MACCNRMKCEVADLQRFIRRTVDLAKADSQRKPVAPLKPVVVGPTLIIIDIMLSGPAPVGSLLFSDEGVNLGLGLCRPCHDEIRVSPITVLVDAGTVHRNEQASV